MSINWCPRKDPVVNYKERITKNNKNCIDYGPIGPNNQLILRNSKTGANPIISLLQYLENRFTIAQEISKKLQWDRFAACFARLSIICHKINLSIYNRAEWHYRIQTNLFEKATNELQKLLKENKNMIIPKEMNELIVYFSARIKKIKQCNEYFILQEKAIFQ